MDYPELELKVREVVAKKLDVDIETIGLHSLLGQDLGMDCFTSIELAFALEDQFSVKIPEAGIYRTMEIKDIIDDIADHGAQ